MNFLTNPTTETVIEVYIAFMIASAFVQSLPTPAEISGVWYKALYNFLSVLITDFKSFVKTPTTAQSASSTTSTTVLPSGTIETVKSVDTATSTTTSGSAATLKTGV